MKMNLKNLPTVIALSLTLFSSAASAERITISDSQIPYFAMLKGTTSHFLLVSNPKLCADAPGPCRFFIESSYGHVHLNHLIQSPKAYTQHDLQQADCFAVYNVAAADIQETVKLMLLPEQAERFSIQGDLQARATNLQTCSEKAGK